jgi:hypothetical protein
MQCFSAGGIVQHACRLVVALRCYFAIQHRLMTDSRQPVCGMAMTSSDLDRSTVETAYPRSAPVYDAVCEPIMVSDHGDILTSKACRRWTPVR